MKCASLIAGIALSACLPVYANVFIPLSVDSVETKRARDVLIRVIQYNSDRAEVRLEMIRPIRHSLLSIINIKSFSLNDRIYEFALCDEFSVNKLEVLDLSIKMELECFLPKAIAVIGDCELPILGERFGELACTRVELDYKSVEIEE